MSHLNLKCSEIPFTKTNFSLLLLFFLFLSLQLRGVVSFHRAQQPNELLNDWSHSCSKLMQLVQKTTHLINKEEMVHKHLKATAGKD